MSDSKDAAGTRKSQKTRNSYKFTAEQFVETWTKSEHLEDVVEGLAKVVGKEVPANIIRSREAKYRRDGVNLKFLQSKNSKKKLNVEQLNKIVSGEAHELDVDHLNVVAAKSLVEEQKPAA